MSEDARNCLIGVFDVLGYQSFLKNNSATATAQKVLTNLNSLSSRVEQQVQELSPPPVLKIQVNWLVFSDTVLLSTDYSDDFSDGKKWIIWMNFLSSSIYLNNFMFEYGLPLRGGISVGKVLIQNNCFAGKPIVEAFQLATDLELAGTALTRGTAKEIKRVVKSVVSHPRVKKKDKAGIRVLEKLTIKYLPARKSGNQDRIDMLNVVSLRNPIDYSGDIRQLLLECFMGHNKDMTGSAKAKLDNTELFLRYCIGQGRKS